jgi:quercetin dioxygenase-like cupin family protein
MAKNTLISLFENGNVICTEKIMSMENVPWVKHPVFEGVFMKNLITAAETHGAFSCHLARISPGHSVDEHSHSELWEFNEVLEGIGTMTLADKTITCKAGDSFVNPPGVPHSLTASDGELYITAKFVPALL